MPQISIENVTVEVIRKPIKNLHLRVYPPDGSVRLSVPRHMGNADIHAAVHARLEWIRKQQAKIASRTYTVDSKYVTGELHAFLGARYPLVVAEAAKSRPVQFHGDGALRMTARAGALRAERQKLLEAWYRAQIKQRIPVLIARWEPVLGVQVAEWGVKRMTTKWGTCNVQARRIWLNLELIKKPVACLEYVVVHEMVHLLERSHNARFWALLDTFLPDWRAQKQELNRQPPGTN